MTPGYVRTRPLNIYGSETRSNLVLLYDVVRLRESVTFQRHISQNTDLPVKN